MKPAKEPHGVASRGLVTPVICQLHAWFTSTDSKQVFDLHFDVSEIERKARCSVARSVLRSAPI